MRYTRHAAVAGAVHAAFAAALAATPVEAAETARRTELQEVVVTAQRREQRLVDVPLAIQAMPGPELERTGVRDVTDVVRVIPGASEGRSNTAATKTFQIRGVSSYYGEPTIGYYVDEAAFVVPNRNYAPVLSTFDLERVEVLRGPQGTLYGLGSLGGTMRFITVDPDTEAFGAKAQLGASNTAGGDDNWYGDAAVNVPIAGIAGLRLSGSKSSLGGYAESPSFPGDLNSVDQSNYRARLLVRPGERLVLKLGAQRVEVDDHWGRNLATADPPAYPRSTVPGRNEAEYDYYTGALTYDAGGLRVEATSGLMQRDDRGLIPLNGGVLRVRGESRMFTQELRLVSASGGFVEWVAGGIYQDGRNTETANLQVPIPRPPPAPPLNATLRDDTSRYETSSYAVYGEVAFNLMDGRLKPLIGVRWFNDDRDFLNTDRTPPFPGAPPPANPRVSSARDTFTQTSPRFNLSYRLSDAAMVYGNVAKGFRSGTFNTNAGIAAAASIGLTVGQAVDPDSLWSYELGTKLEWADGRLLTEFAVYRFDWESQQLNFDAGATRTQVIVNAGDTVGQGIEYALTWRAAEGLTLAATGNFNSTEFDEIYDPRLFRATPNIAEGRQVASVPKQTHAVSATYTRPLGWRESSLFVHVGYTHVARQGDPGDSGTPPATPGGRFGEAHDLVRARLGLETEHWSAYLVGDNLLDSSGAIQVSGSGQTRHWPRTLGVELRVDF
jgi:outer membrane receptor protein involved in Fe transport